MNSRRITALLLFLCISVFGQQKLTLEEIWGGAFRGEGMDELQSLKKTNQYTVLNFDRTSRSMQVDLYDYATLKKVATLIDTKEHKNLPMIDSYTFNSKENMILLACESDQIFRHSFGKSCYKYSLF